MAKKIYIGNMLQEVQTSIAALQTDMGTMSTDMASMVSELIALKTTVASGVQYLNISPSDNAKYELTEDKILAVSSANVYESVMAIKCFTSGYLRFNGVVGFTGVGGSYITKIAYKINNGAYIDIASKTALVGSFTLPFDVDISTANGDVISIAIHRNNFNHNGHKLLTGTYIGYDIVDVVNDGSVSVLIT